MKKAFLTAALVVSGFIAAHAQSSQTKAPAVVTEDNFGDWVDSVRRYNTLSTRTKTQQASYMDALNGLQKYLRAKTVKAQGQEIPEAKFLHAVDSLLRKETAPPAPVIKP